VRQELDMPIATLMDTKGPEIRLKTFENGKVELIDGQTFTLTTDDVVGTSERASITYANLKKDIAEDAIILIDDGLIEMKVEKMEDNDIVCRVLLEKIE